MIKRRNRWQPSAIWVTLSGLKNAEAVGKRRRVQELERRLRQRKAKLAVALAWAVRLEAAI